MQFTEMTHSHNAFCVNQQAQGHLRQIFRKKKRQNKVMSHNGRLPFWLQVTGLHTLDGLFSFLGFRLDLCFEPLDFALFRGQWGLEVGVKV